MATEVICPHCTGRLDPSAAEKYYRPLSCQICGTTITRARRQGRDPKYCENCKPSVETGYQIASRRRRKERERAT